MWCWVIGMAAIEFVYNVEWPLSLVITNTALTNYGILFRHLLYCKRVEKDLCATWKTNIPRGSHVCQVVYVSRSCVLLMVLISALVDLFITWQIPHTASTRIHVLRQRMLYFVHSLLFFTTFEVIEPNWRKLEEQLKGVCVGLTLFIYMCVFVC